MSSHKKHSPLAHPDPVPIWLRIRNGIAISILIVASVLGLFWILTSPSVPLSPPEIGEMVVPEISRSTDIRFDQPSVLKGWHEHVFNKKSRYKIEADETGEMALHASSQDAYSVIFKLINTPVHSRPILSWQWRAVKFPAGKKYQGLGAKDENDFAIRVCAVFGNNPFALNILQYVWDDHYPAGTHDKDPYSDNVRMLVVRSGVPVKTSDWTLETRDVIKDYELAFGKPPSSDLKAISIISNSDDTHTVSEAYVRRIWIERSMMEPDIKKWRLNLLIRTERLEHRLRGLFRHLNLRGMERIKLRRSRSSGSVEQT